MVEMTLKTLPAEAAGTAENQVAAPVVWALIVCFHPDARLLLDLVQTILSQVSRTLVLNNGGMRDELLNELSALGAIVHDMEGNKGIASALNEGFSRAARNGVDFVVTFDQDSSPQAGHVAKLVEKWFELSSTSGIGRKTGAIGPSFYDDRDKGFSYPFYVAEGFKVVKQFAADNKSLVRADALITSGMLVPISMWKDDLRFKDLLFIDFVDTEWCFRAKKAGYVHYGCFDVKMKHELSESSPLIFLGLIILKYSPMRRYYHFRNCLYLVSRSYVPWPFRIRLVFGLLLRFVTVPAVDDKPSASFKGIFSGVFDAIRGRFGPRGA